MLLLPRCLSQRQGRWRRRGCSLAWGVSSWDRSGSDSCWRLAPSRATSRSRRTGRLRLRLRARVLPGCVDQVGGSRIGSLMTPMGGMPMSSHGHRSTSTRPAALLVRLRLTAQCPPHLFLAVIHEQRLRVAVQRVLSADMAPAERSERDAVCCYCPAPPTTGSPPAAAVVRWTCIGPEMPAWTRADWFRRCHIVTCCSALCKQSPEQPWPQGSLRTRAFAAAEVAASAAGRANQRGPIRVVWADRAA